MSGRKENPEYCCKIVGQRVSALLYDFAKGYSLRNLRIA